jgi:hypothetical protein
VLVFNRKEHHIVPTSSSRLSKSRFVDGCQCPLRLWFNVNARDLATPPDKGVQAIFDTGARVGELARQRWPGGVLIEEAYWEVDAALERTRKLMSNLAVPAIYEAAIEHEGVLIRVDVLARGAEGGWELVEVKSGTRLKEPSDTEVALQHWVLRGAGLDVRRTGLMVLNREYVYSGSEYDLQQLFRLVELTQDSQGRLNEIDEKVAAFRVVVAGEAPDIDIGDHCHTPNECPYYGHCARDVVLPEWPVSVLPRLGSKREELLALGAETIDAIPEDFPLNETQARVRDCTLSGQAWVSPRLRDALEAVEWPLYFLDFEAAGLALPRFTGTRPYDALPFQFSCHRQAAHGVEPTHDEFLATDDTDPREALARALLEAVGSQGSIVVYSSYERQMINALASWLPHLADALRALPGRLFDLLPVVKNHYYHPAFRGSYSIKAVLPALVPTMDYEDMEVADGMAAVRIWEQMLCCDDATARARMEQALRHYCQQDSLAMLKIREGLLEAAAE